jgi:hypothetical protein
MGTLSSHFCRIITFEPVVARNGSVVPRKTRPVTRNSIFTEEEGIPAIVLGLELQCRSST